METKHTPPLEKFQIELLKISLKNWRDDEIKFIVRAVNSHDELLSAAKAVLFEFATPLVTGQSDPLRKLETAIKKAEAGL